MASERVIKPWLDMLPDEQDVYEADVITLIGKYSDYIDTHRDGVDIVTSKALGFWIVANPGLFDSVDPELASQEFFDPNANALEFRLGNWKKDNVVRFHDTVCMVVAEDIEGYEINPFDVRKRITGGIGFRQHE